MSARDDPPEEDGDDDEVEEKRWLTTAQDKLRGAGAEGWGALQARTQHQHSLCSLTSQDGGGGLGTSLRGGSNLTGSFGEATTLFVVRRVPIPKHPSCLSFLFTTKSQARASRLQQHNHKPLFFILVSNAYYCPPAICSY